MILVFIAALVFAAFDGVRRVEPIDWTPVREQAFLPVIFALVALLKLSLQLSLRTRRVRHTESAEEVPGDVEPPW